MKPIKTPRDYEEEYLEEQETEEEEDN